MSFIQGQLEMNLELAVLFDKHHQEVHDKLRNGVQPRREEIWYAVNGLVPQTMALLLELRRKQPVWFEVGY